MQRVKFRLQQIGRAACDGFGAFQYALLQFAVHWRRRGAILALEYAGGLAGDGLIALTGQHIEHRLRTHDLRGGCDQRNKAQVFPHPGNLLQHVVQAIHSALLPQLVLHVGEHAAGNLGHQDATVNAAQGALEFRVFLAHVAEIGGNGFQFFDIQAGIPLGALQDGDHRFGRRVPVGHGHGRDRRIHVVDTSFYTFKDGRRRQARGGVTLHVYRNIAGLFQARNQFKPIVGPEQTCHVLDRDRVGTHVLDLFTQGHPGIDVVHGTDRVGNRALCVFAHCGHRLERNLDVAHIVHGVEYPEHIDPVGRRAFDKALDHIVGIVAIAKNVLASKKHLLARVRHRLFEFADAIPGVFPQVADAGIEGRTAPGFH